MRIYRNKRLKNKPSNIGSSDQEHNIEKFNIFLKNQRRGRSERETKGKEQIIFKEITTNQWTVS